MTTFSPFVPEVAAVLQVLDQARCDAVFANADRWDYSVPVQKLLDLGARPDHIRWMDAANWIELGHEVAPPAGGRRVFAKTQRGQGPVRWCAVLTKRGQYIARDCQGIQVGAESRLNGSSISNRNGSSKQPDLGDPMINGYPRNGRQQNGHRQARRERNRNEIALSTEAPVWNERKRELTLGGRVVKCYRGRAPNQVRILSAFQEEGWPAAIDDPLPPREEIDAKRRLHDTIKSLNRNQVVLLLRFRGNGTGEMIAWEVVQENTA